MDFRVLSPFPSDFLWGGSSSAYQSEGAVRTEGKGLSVQDVMPKMPGTAGFRVAVDHYFNFKQDIAMLAEMGFKAYRFSISWSRLLPTGRGLVNPLGVQHYHQVIDQCLAYGIQPIVTLYHFDLPWDLHVAGGWNNRRTIDDFVAYCELCFKEYGSQVPYFLTINEQNMMIMYNTGLYGSDRRRWQACHNMLVASAKAMASCHRLCPAKIGPAPNIANIYPATASPADVKAASDFDEIRNHIFIQPLTDGTYPGPALAWLRSIGCEPDCSDDDRQLLRQAHPDFLAFNYYGGETVRYVDRSQGMAIKARGRHYWRLLRGMEAFKKDFVNAKLTLPGVCTPVYNPLQEHTAYGMGLDPIGLQVTLRQLYERYQLPLLITENGCGAADELQADGTIHDDYRIDYLRRHILACRRAITEGVPLVGYCPWSAFDLISTHQGITKRYGFIYVDRDEHHIRQLRRIRKDSFYWYQKVIASNGQDLG